MEMINCFPYCCDCSTNYNSLQITLWNCVAKCNKSADSWWCTVGHQENVLWWETQCIRYCCGFLLWWHKWIKFSSWNHLLTTLCMSNLFILHIPNVCHLPLATISFGMAQFQHFWGWWWFGHLLQKVWNWSLFNSTNVQPSCFSTRFFPSLLLHIFTEFLVLHLPAVA